MRVAQGSILGTAKRVFSVTEMLSLVRHGVQKDVRVKGLCSVGEVEEQAIVRSVQGHDVGWVVLSHPQILSLPHSGSLFRSAQSRCYSGLGDSSLGVIDDPGSFVGRAGESVFDNGEGRPIEDRHKLLEVVLANSELVHTG